MMPTFDFMNLVRRVIKLALKTVTSRVASALTFATTVTSLFAALDLDSIIFDFIPQFPDLADYYNAIQFHGNLTSLILYCIAGDYFVKVLSSVLDFIQYVLAQLPIFLVAFVSAIWSMKVLRATRKDIGDAVT